MYNSASTSTSRQLITLTDDSLATIVVKLWNQDIGKVEIPLIGTEVVVSNVMVNVWEGRVDLNANRRSKFEVSYCCFYSKVNTSMFCYISTF